MKRGDMEIAVGVTTAERRVDYLSATLRSLNEAGFSRPLVVAVEPP